jgi:hypothetical protein
MDAPARTNPVLARYVFLLRLLFALFGLMGSAAVTHASAVVTPTFSPVAGTYTSAQSVTITTTTSGASIRYTTNGTTPSSTVGTVYSGPVAISTTTTLKAIAYKSGFTNSKVTSGTYTINLPTAATPTFSPAAGTYTSVQSVTITSTTSGASIRYTTDGSTPSATAGTLYSSPVSISTTTTLKAIAYKTGFNNSAVKSGLYTINLPTVATPAFSPAAGTFASAQTVTITTTTSGASIRYTTDGSTPSATAGTLYSGPVSIGVTTTLKAIAFKTNFNNSAVTTGLYTINLPTVMAPTFSPVAGTYTSVQSVTITSATSGASIRYTTDGSTPSATAGILYSGPVSISATTTLKAIAYKTGFNNSTVTSGLYTINIPPPAITSSLTATGQVGTAFSYQITATNSPTSYNATGLASGLAVNPSTGTITGTPAIAGTSNITISASNSGGTGSATLTLAVNPQPVTFTISPVSFTYNGSVQGPVITPSVSGATFSISGTATATSAGSHSVTATATGNYTGASAATAWTIAQATPVISWTGPASITYGTALDATQLDATANVPGTFVYAPAAGTVLNAGTQTLSVAFTPTDATDYTSASASVSLTVNAEPVTFTVSPSSFTYNGSAQGPVITPSVSGATYSTSGTATATSAGSYSVTATATGNYTGTSAATSWTIAQATPVISWPAPAPITYGTALDSTELNATANVPGTFAYTPAAGTVLNIGTQTLSVAFTPTDTTDYNNAPASVSLTVTPPPPLAPVFSPSGGTFTSAQSVTITSSGSTAIYFTTDGSTPTTSSPLYTAAVTISANTVLQAVGVNSGGSSPVASASFVILPPPQAPVFNSGAGTYTSAQAVTITSVNATAVYYTTDGSTPTSSSPLYSGPIPISSSVTLQAIGVNGAGSSPVTSGTYTINIPPFTNSSIPGLRLWLEADAGVATDTKALISTWADQSGNGNDATQTNASQQPTLVMSGLNNRPVVHFGGSQELGVPVAVLSGESAAEFFVVTKVTTTTPSVDRRLWNFGRSWGTIYPSTTGTISSEETASFDLRNLGTPPQGLTAYHLYNVSSQNGYWANRFNGLLWYATTSNQFTGPSGYGYTLGGGLFGTCYDGDISEIIVYNQVLTPAQRDIVGAYLGSKYGLYTAPPVPASLAATPLSPGQVSLQWSAPARSDHVNYLVERSTDGVTFTQVVSVADGLSCIDPGLTAGTTYTYRVRAQGYAGTSGYSNLAAATTPAGGTDMPLTSQQGLCLWLKADTGVTANAGAAISTWADQSSNGNNASQGTGSNQPTLVTSDSTLPNSRPVVRFNGSQGLNVNPAVLSGANSAEFFVVTKVTTKTPSMARRLWNFGRSTGTIYPNTDGTISSEETASFDLRNLGTPPQDLTTYHLYNVSSQNGYWANRFNGLLWCETTNNQFVAASAPTLGVGNFNNNPFDGDIAEVIVYNTVLTQAQRSTVSAYLGSKYNLSIAPPVAAPVISPVAGTYNNVQSVTITCATNGATIRYTTDGSTPHETTGTVYTGVPVNISSATTLQAVAYKSGFADSPVTSSAYTLQTAPLVFTPAPGTYANTQVVAISTATAGATIRYTIDGRTPNEIAGTVYTGPVTISSTATLQAIAYESGFTPDSRATGTYTLQAAAPVPSLPAGIYANAQAVNLASATSGATICYTTDGSTPTETHGTVYTGAPLSISSATTLQAIAYETGFADSSVASNFYTIGSPQVAAPIFSPAAGNTVTITSATSGAAIRYTTDGSTPNETTGNLYSGPLTISSPTTLKAIAYASGYTDSPVTSATIGMPTITIVTPANGSTIGN